jgi:hypothetical protein
VAVNYYNLCFINTLYDMCLLDYWRHVSALMCHLKVNVLQINIIFRKVSKDVAKYVIKCKTILA